MTLSGCGSIDAGEVRRVYMRSIESAESQPQSRENLGLPSLTLQMGWREQAMATNVSFNPQLWPSQVPQDFEQQTWSKELPLMAPQVTAILTSDFGWRGLYNKRDFHSGIDIAAAAGTVIYTPVPGQVLYVKHAGTDSGVVITDGERQHTFWHTKPAPGLKRGDWLDRGYRVGTMVKWGSRTHLHYSVHLTGPSDTHKARNDGNAIDPLTLIRRLKQGVIAAKQAEAIQAQQSELAWTGDSGLRDNHRSLMLAAAHQSSPSERSKPAQGPELTYRVETLLPERP